MEYVKKRKWAILGVIMLYATAIALLYFQDDLKREIALINIKEGAQKVDTSMICFEEETSLMGYSQWFAQNGGGASPIPLVHLDKLSDEEEEIFISYPEHFPHTEYFDGPEDDALLGNSPRNPIGKWVGRGLLTQPHGWWMPYNKRKKVCSKRGGVDVPEPNVLALALTALTALTALRMARNTTLIGVK